MTIDLMTPRGMGDIYKLPAGAVLSIGEDIWLIIRNKGQWCAVNQKNQVKSLITFCALIYKKGHATIVYTPNVDEYND